MKNSTTLILFSLSFGLVSAIAEPDLSKLPAPSTKTGLSYAKDIRPIFESSCFRCHGEERHKGGLRLDNLEAALKGGEDGKVIVPGKSKESPLVLAVARIDEKTAMPPKPKGRGPSGAGNRPASAPGASGNRPPGTPANSPAKEAGASQPSNPSRGPGGPGGMGPMPKSLTPEQVGLIRAWIDQGAK